MDDENGLAEEGAEKLRESTEDIQSALSRPGENWVQRWFLLEGRRSVVTAALLAVVFLVLLGASVLRPVDLRDLVTETNAVSVLFSSLLSGAILLVSIVVSINSVVLSQQMQDLENQQDRTAAALQFRRDIEDVIPADVTPARPAEFIRVVLYTILRQVNELQDVAADTGEDEFQHQLESLGEKVSDDVDRVREILENATYGSFDVLLAGLNYDYSGQLHATRAIKRRYGSDLTDEERAAIDALIDSLTFFTTGREYFKSLYYERELAELSSRLLYVSLPVIVFISYVLLAVDARQFPDTWVLGVPPLIIFLAFAYTVALAPYVVLTAYVIRAATVSRRTLAAGPFVFQKGAAVDPLDFESYEEDIEWESEMADE